MLDLLAAFQFEFNLDEVDLKVYAQGIMKLVKLIICSAAEPPSYPGYSPADRGTKKQVYLPY